MIRSRGIDLESVLHPLATVAGSCLAVALLDHGFTPRSPLGEPHSMHRGDLRLEPFTVAAAVDDPGADDRWAEAIRGVGLEGATLRLASNEKGAGSGGAIQTLTLTVTAELAVTLKSPR